MSTVAALLLAAGKSTRSKKFKPLADWQGETFLERTYHQLSDTKRFCEILVVTGFQSALLEESLGRLHARSVFNADFEQGMQGSIQIGMRSLKPGWLGVLICFVDQPQLESRHYLKILNSFDGSPRTLLRPGFQGRLGNPALIGAAYLEEILAESPSDRGCAYLFERYPQQCTVLEMPDELCLLDYDNVE